MDNRWVLVYQRQRGHELRLCCVTKNLSRDKLMHTYIWFVPSQTLCLVCLVFSCFVLLVRCDVCHKQSMRDKHRSGSERPSVSLIIRVHHRSGFKWQTGCGKTGSYDDKTFVRIERFSEDKKWKKCHWGTRVHPCEACTMKPVSVLPRLWPKPKLPGRNQ